ncbi:hypothetical protein ACA910_013292 [Epithemia clementina (nom. ined.)]
MLSSTKAQQEKAPVPCLRARRVVVAGSTHVALAPAVPPTSTPKSTVTLAEHEAALARERSLVQGLQNANIKLRKEIEQRDKLEEQMESEICRLTQTLDVAIKQTASLERELAKEKAETLKVMKQKLKLEKALEKAKEKHKELRVDVKKRKRAAFAAIADAKVSGLIDNDSQNDKRKADAAAEMSDSGQDDSGGQEKKAKKNLLVGQTSDGLDSKHDLNWKQMFEELKKYKMDFGHCDVPAKSKFTDPKYARLACWVSTQRTQHKLLREGKWTTLKPERVRQLQALGFKWHGQPHTVTLTFDDRLTQLLEYKRRHGDCNVPQKCDDYSGLGNYVLQQRKHYRLGKLSKDRIERLEAIGFQWSLRNRGGPLAERMKPSPGKTANNRRTQAEEKSGDDEREGTPFSQGGGESATESQSRPLGYDREEESSQETATIDDEVPTHQATNNGDDSHESDIRQQQEELSVQSQENFVAAWNQTDPPQQLHGGTAGIGIAATILHTETLRIPPPSTGRSTWMASGYKLF